jgi:hypothetical protein
MAEDWKIDVGVPDVGDIVEYQGARYRVSGWLRDHRPPRPLLDMLFSSLIDDIVYEAQHQIQGTNLQWCYRDEAQFVILTGIAGVVAAVDQVHVVGKVPWPQEHIDEARQQAVLLAEKAGVLF